MASLGALVMVATRVDDVSSVCLPASLAILYSQRKWIEGQRDGGYDHSIQYGPYSHNFCDL